jgi:hypothetical protein
VKFAGHASAEMPADAHRSWLAASTLGWLKGYDKVIMVLGYLPLVVAGPGAVLVAASPV